MEQSEPRSTEDDMQATTPTPTAEGHDRITTKPHALAPSWGVVTAVVLGNGLEFFDFTVYSFFASIIGKLYFPSHVPLISLLAAVGTFGIGFLLRPLGAMVLGGYADRHGRKKAMNLTILLMAAGTGLIGFAPTYASIGLAAPAIILFARMLQGFSAGGEVGTAGAYLVEHAPPGRRGLQSSWLLAGAGGAILLGAGLGAALSTVLSQQALESWGWRVPFIVGLLIGPVGAYIRRYLGETLPEEAHGRHARNAPLRELFRNHLRTVLAVSSVAAVGTSATYVLMYYMPTYATRSLGLPMSTALLSSCLAGLMMLVLCPVAGMICDRIGRKRAIAIGVVAMAVLIYPSFMLLKAFPRIEVLLGVMSALVCIYVVFAVPQITLMAEQFPQSVRASGMSIVYAIAVAIFGGFSQLFVTLLIAWTGSALAPAGYLLVLSLISLLALFFVKEAQGQLDVA
ncbi:MFS transporter [Paraburkholderia sp.]|uniref:MFS transporter n=1 Tax=Paraburkholderia sp. TaxID=1926495 RepID=UPI00257D1397|nr:MFS transporter [Paraburkholderia sp.]